MRVLVVPSPLLGLPAEQVGELVASAWATATGRPGDVVAVNPWAVPERVEIVTVPGPWGRPVPAQIALRGDRTAVLDTTSAAGPQLRQDGDDPLAASSAGIGALVLAARDLGARTIVLPLDDLVCHDGGAGLVGALAGREAATPGDLGAADLDAAAAALARVRLVGRFEDDVPLLGLQGASATQAEAKSMTPEISQAAENALGAFVDRMRRLRPEPRDLLSGAVLRRDRTPGAGAGGGLGHGVLLLGGILEESAPAIVREAGLAERVAAADLVVTCTDRFDWRVLRSSVPRTLSELAAPLLRPVVLLAGESEAGRREAMSLGLAGVYDVVETHRARRGVLADPPAAIAARVVRVARTWEPPRGA